jgi:Tol biopolymer transport system component
MKIAKIFFLLILMTVSLSALDLVLTSKNIYLSNMGNVVQLTFKGNASYPILSPDEKSIVYIRTVPKNSYEYKGEDSIPTEIVLMDLESKQEKIILKEKPSTDPYKTLRDFSEPIFSSDGQIVYFLSNAWVTSSAVYALDLKTLKTQFIIDGNDLAIIKSGDYKNYIIIDRHQYFVDGGSYDSSWLVSPNGKVIGQVRDRNSYELYQHANE